MNKQLLATMIAAVTAIAGCAVRAPEPVVTENLNVGIAKTCNASPLDLSTSTSATATIEMTNDGWCAVRAKEKDSQPFLLGLMRARPQHGIVLIQKLGGETRVEYSANERYVGTDRFTVALRSRTPNAPDTTIQIAVNVGMGEGMAAPSTSPAEHTPTPATRKAPVRRAASRAPVTQH